MKDIFIAGENMITSLGFTPGETMAALLNNTVGLKTTDDRSLTPSPVTVSRVDTHQLESRFAELILVYRPELANAQFTRMEKLFILSIDEAISSSPLDLANGNTILVISSTKGNIDLLEERYNGVFPGERIFLWKMAEVIRDFFKMKNKPVVISNACISGVVAIGLAARLLRSGQFDHAIVSGGDILSEFVISGFLAFQALSPEPCKPYDASRNGLSLGEGCGTVILTGIPPDNRQNAIIIPGFATSNDATHISAPSRTGEELALAISKAINEASLNAGVIDYISAHGTATLYNDEMESKALNLGGFGEVPVNSFKGYWGHTLGGAGVIESVAAIQCLKQDMLIRSAGFKEQGVPEKINVIMEHKPAVLRNVLKVASGFGGCNAALIFSKLD